LIGESHSIRKWNNGIVEEWSGGILDDLNIKSYTIEKIDRDFFVTIILDGMKK